MKPKANKLTAGRNLLWESSRMMLPEHKERILEHRKTLDDAPQPELDEQRLEELSLILAEAVRSAVEVEITFYQSGQDIKRCGKPANSHFFEGKVKLLTAEGAVWIPFADIRDVNIR